MITLKRLDLIRKDSPATADELASLQTQLNALPLFNVEPFEQARHIEPLPAAPVGFIEVSFRGASYVLPFFAKVTKV